LRGRNGARHHVAFETRITSVPAKV
jgi:hypothetical protein